jgi:hypothetical protein
MGAALTYARRYALFALVGIAGEDDLDAPDTLAEPSPQPERQPDQASPRRPPHGTVHRPHKQPALDPGSSKQLRDLLLTEINDLKAGDDLALWAHRRLPSKNALAAEDARLVEAAYQVLLETNITSEPHDPSAALPTAKLKPTPLDTVTAVSPPAMTTEPQVTPLTKPVRRRNKAHLLFVGTQPCLICKRAPCDAHHLKFAQPRALGRKVSDEFTVPLCRAHHQELHRHGNEAAWWTNLQIAAIQVAKHLWQESPIHGAPSSANLLATSNVDPTVHTVPTGGRT